MKKLLLLCALASFGSILAADTTATEKPAENQVRIKNTGKTDLKISLEYFDKKLNKTITNAKIIPASKFIDVDSVDNSSKIPLSNIATDKGQVSVSKEKKVYELK
ncbi:hypothetical protein CVU75_01335 [Candidatus Dependentiae bacterium HGW-Dependentiae-1]|nr:MAG: hypothetical protein CVU75_01335 [Candidatus Dependentiae bacterium HGW-Dependentiae-1]